jgi:hypothetical protein
MKLWNRFQNNSFPLWEVTDAEPDYLEPTNIIRVKVKKPLPKDSLIKIRGNAINSDWNRMKMPFFYINGRRFRIRTPIDQNQCKLLVRVKAKVRVPELERQHAEDIRRQTIKKFREYRR